MKVSIGISNHHVHVTEEDFRLLFGEEAVLEFFKGIHQPNQFASCQKVDIKTTHGELLGLRILGPFRDYTQVELSQTDCRCLKISAPVCSSGNLKGASEVTIVGSSSSITKPCAIIADRHIHMTREDRERLGLMDVSEVCVQIDTIKGGILDHVQLREAPNSYFEMHLDTDDANGFLIDSQTEGKIILP